VTDVVVAVPLDLDKPFTCVFNYLHVVFNNGALVVVTGELTQGDFLAVVQKSYCLVYNICYLPVAQSI
jgi:hypothetical protein